jgi:hypothetical protein
MKSIKPIKKPSVSKLKKKAWDLFSKWIRSQDAEKGMNMCITCGVWKPWKELQAGHFIPGRHNSILFDERGVHPQCYHCNVGLKGNPRSYDRYMRTMYGEKVIEELETLDQQIKNFKPYELEEIIKMYTKKLKKIGIL